VTLGGLRRRSLDLLRSWTAIPSVAGDAAALRRMAGEVTAFLRDQLGAQIVASAPGGDAPLVHARIDRGRGRALLLYNMYDVMPATGAGWSVPPFRGGVVDLPGLGACFVGRGAENNKGPLAGMLVALAALLEADALDADLEILVEGQEETGSRALRAYLQDPSGLVRRCGAALFPSFCEYGGGPPRVYLGSKGIAHGRIRVAGGAWGGPRRAIHSSNAPWIGNPAWRLVQALAPLGGGALGNVPLPDEARPMLAALAKTFDPAAELAFRHAERFALPGTPAALLEHVLTATALNLSSLSTGAEADRAVTPATAEARFDLRLPPGADLPGVLADLRHALAAHDASLELDDAYPGHRFGPGEPAVRALIDSYHAAGAAPQVWPWAIGAMPACAFAAAAPCCLIGGLGRGGNAHGIDEYVTLEGLDRFLRFLLAWLPATAAVLPFAVQERPA